MSHDSCSLLLSVTDRLAMEMLEDKSHDRSSLLPTVTHRVATKNAGCHVT
jgi:hypothetical protein